MGGGVELWCCDHEACLWVHIYQLWCSVAARLALFMLRSLKIHLFTEPQCTLGQEEYPLSVSEDVTSRPGRDLSVPRPNFREKTFSAMTVIIITLRSTQECSWYLELQLY